MHEGDHFFTYMVRARYGTAMDHISEIGILGVSWQSGIGSVSMIQIEPCLTT